ncbi:retrotransposon protein [Cucumis melo var. makuwa]|uniref:Retrotransposon protein n=1 Tax=Cucumis melo var. makuwa TaxID=1194695 RepID=A0A5D3D5F8_CUCMM|nr:retrotransposon protein [Cucumis melo var. makuwa]TYK18794.1 retrotransposon protein [Cucumis melo var. makuwa]
MGGWKSDNGTFRPGYLTQLVHIMSEKLPGCQVRPTIVTDYRKKTLKWIFQAIAEMRGPTCSGFVNGLLNKPFIYYDELAYAFGRDRAVGRFAKTFVDVESKEPVGYERFDMLDVNEDFPSVYS